MELNLTYALAAGFIPALRQFVSDQKIHPILVNFTAALIPFSIGADFVARLLKKDSLRAAAWWTLLVGICVTPLTAVAGWLFWMSDDQGVTAMTIHKWLGTSLAVLLFGLLLWRWRLARQKRWASVPYLCAGIVVIAALIYQGHLGGDQTYGDMASAAPTALQATLHTTARYPRRDREGAWLLCPLRRNAS